MSTTKTQDTTKIQDTMVEVDRLLQQLEGTERQLHAAGFGLLPCYPGDAIEVYTVTRYYVGEVVRVSPDASWVWLRKVSWVSTTGRQHQWAAGEIPANAEIEAFPPDQIRAIHLGAAVEVGPCLHPLPLETR